MRWHFLLLAGALGLAANSLYLGAPDRPARFHGLARIQLADGSVCTAAFRVEDIGGRSYLNRWHYIIQAVDGCNLVAFGPAVRHNDVWIAGDSKAVAVAGWGTMTYQPMDPELRAWDVSFDHIATDYPGGWDRIITFRQITGNVWELLIEEPRCPAVSAERRQIVACPANPN
jgi:hypothetical protein